MKLTKELLSEDLTLAIPDRDRFPYRQSILSLTAIEKSLTPITCQIHSERRQSSLIKLSITGEDMVVQILGRREKRIFLPSILPEQIVQLPLTRVSFSISGL